MDKIKIVKIRKDGIKQSYNVKLFVSWNYTDNIPGPIPYPMPKTLAKKYLANYLKVLKKNQGYYRTARGERIPISKVEIELVSEDFIPYKK